MRVIVYELCSAMLYYRSSIYIVKVGFHTLEKPSTQLWDLTDFPPPPLAHVSLSRLVFLLTKEMYSILFLLLLLVLGPACTVVI